MKLSVVILNYKVPYFLEQCLLSVQRAIDPIEAEIIVIDNHSQDGSCEMVKERFQSVILLENRENVGFAIANNQAVAVAKGAYVCILNPDTAVAEDTFLKVLEHAETMDNMGALGVYLMDGTGNFLPESKRNLPKLGIALKKLLGFSKNNSYYAKQLGDKENGEVPVLVGAFMLMKRKVYLEVGGFDEDYFMYGEDIDLSYSITKAGYQNCYCGGIRTLHYKGESTARDRTYYRRFYGAMRIFYRKHFSKNLFMNACIGLGLRLIGSNGKKKSTPSKTSPPPAKSYVFTESLGLLKALSAAMEHPLQTASKSILADSTFNNTLFIFDVDYMSYAQIFSVMEAQKNKGNTFRIRPPGCNFILGSDHSDQKGTVLTF